MNLYDNLTAAADEFSGEEFRVLGSLWRVNLIDRGFNTVDVDFIDRPSEASAEMAAEELAEAAGVPYYHMENIGHAGEVVNLGSLFSEYRRRVFGD